MLVYKLMAGLALAFVVASPWVFAEPDYEDFRQDYGKEYQHYNRDFHSGFQAYKDEYRKALADFKQELIEKWGYADVPSSSKYVVYSEEKDKKLIVDYSSGSLTVASITPAGNEELNRFLVEVLDQTVYEYQGHSVSLIQTLGLDQAIETDKYVAQLVQGSESVQEAALVKENIISLGIAVSAVERSVSVEGEKLSEQDEKYIRDLKNEERQASNKLLQLIQDPSSKQTQVKKIGLHASRWNRAKSYQHMVSDEAEIVGLDQALIYAIIEAESNFNPQAVSPVPAFGMMQIVPMTAGVDVNEYLYRQKKPPRKEVLFNPARNIKFGATYLYLLNNRYFKGVKNVESRLYCVIAAYNTGMGHVAQAFLGYGQKNVAKALPFINAMEPGEVKSKLLVDLPYDETKAYLEKVLDGYAFYSSQLQVVFR